MLKKLTRTMLAGVATAGLALSMGTAMDANAQDSTKLRIQTHFSTETLSGQMAQEFIDDVSAMSNGEIEIEMFFASSVVKSAETFDAAATGILDCDMTGGAYQTGKNPAFQFAGDLTGGYQNPYQQYAWLLHGGGYEKLNELYNANNMEFIGWWIPGPESLSSTKSFKGVDDLKNWKFRSPPGVITLIFEKLGASPIVMDFNEIFTALETGIIDGADASGLANNVGLGLYDIVKYANFPGFHSMPSDHLACNKTVFDAMPAHHQTIMKVAMEALALRTALTFEKKNAEAAAQLRDQGVTLSEWSTDELNKFRAAAQATWPEFSDTPEAKALVESHQAYLDKLGLNE